MKMSQRAAVYISAIAFLLLAAATPILFDLGDKPFEPALAQVAESPLPEHTAAAGQSSAGPFSAAEAAEAEDFFLAAAAGTASPPAAVPGASAPTPENTSIPASPEAAVTPSPSPPLTLSAAPAAAPATVVSAVYNGKTASGGRKTVSIAVLYYHSVQDMPGSSAVVSPIQFAEQMQYLADNGYRPLTMAEFSDIMEGKAAAPDKPVLLTFDDGYVDNHSTVMPLLKKLGFPATVFMSPGVMDDKRFITWEQAKDLRDNGWDVLPHGMTHPYLTKLTPEEQAVEILEARKQIEEQLGVTADVFCYPYGQYNNATLKILADNGFRYAFTIEQGKTTPDQHPYKLTRVFVNGREDLEALIRKLTKW